MIRTKLVFLALCLLFISTACAAPRTESVVTPVASSSKSDLPPPTPGGSAPRVVSDNPAGSYNWSIKAPVDDNAYNISGVVDGDIESLTRQTSAGGATFFGFSGIVSGSYFGPEYNGKGFLRLKVEKSNSNLAPVGSVALLKVTDTKAILLRSGDFVDFRCRHQFEALAAVRYDESLDLAKGMWEIDFCRMISPVVTPSGKK